MPNEDFEKPIDKYAPVFVTNVELSQRKIASMFYSVAPFVGINSGYNVPFADNPEEKEKQKNRQEGCHWFYRDVR